MVIVKAVLSDPPNSLVKAVRVASQVFGGVHGTVGTSSPGSTSFVFELELLVVHALLLGERR